MNDVATNFIDIPDIFENLSNDLIYRYFLVAQIYEKNLLFLNYIT
jgi:hypothetical protein